MPTNRPSTILPRRGGWAIIAMIAVMALAGCSDNSVEPSFDDVARGDVETGTVVTIDGEAVGLLTPEAIVVGREGERVLITGIPEGDRSLVDEGDVVVVTGTVAPLTQAVLREAGVEGLVERGSLAEDYIDADLVREQLQAREE